MADYEQKDNSGVIFKNNYKEKDSQPDYKGNMVVDGTEKEVALWIKEGKNGKFFSMKISDPYKKDNQASKKDDDFDPGF